jgi:hypothetical protein
MSSSLHFLLQKGKGLGGKRIITSKRTEHEEQNSISRSASSSSSSGFFSIWPECNLISKKKHSMNKDVHLFIKSNGSSNPIDVDLTDLAKNKKLFLYAYSIKGLPTLAGIPTSNFANIDFKDIPLSMNHYV